MNSLYGRDNRHVKVVASMVNAASEFNEVVRVENMLCASQTIKWYWKSEP
jgi:hypothetical protein